MARRTLRDNHYSDLKSKKSVTETQLLETPNDSYLTGYFNGLETFLAKIDGREPKLKEITTVSSSLDKWALKNL